MTDWGLPDWRSPATYGEIDRWSLDRWRWEFYRRRSDLRNYFDENAAEEYRWDLNKDPHAAKPDAVGFYVTASYKARQEFGYVFIGNPRLGNQPDHLISYFDMGEVESFLDSTRRPLGDYLHLKLAEESPEMLERGLNQLEMGISGFKIPLDPLAYGFAAERDWFLANLALCRAIMLEDWHVAVKFNIEKPIEPQLEVARSILLQMQTERCGKPLQKRRHQKKWLGYLRTLDAREGGASWSEIASMHSETAKTEQTARDVWEQARVLCFNF